MCDDAAERVNRRSAMHGQRIGNVVYVPTYIQANDGMFFSIGQVLISCDFEHYLNGKVER